MQPYSAIFMGSYYVFIIMISDINKGYDDKKERKSVSDSYHHNFHKNGGPRRVQDVLPL